MIKSIRLVNFYSFKDTTIHFDPDHNILIGINGSGKSNLLKAIKLLKEGVAGIGLRKHIFDNLGGFDNMFFKGNENNIQQVIELEFVLDGKFIEQEDDEFNFKEDIFYHIKFVKQTGVQNFYVEEYIYLERPKPEKDYVYLDFKNGKGSLTERKNNKNTLIPYYDYDPQELALAKMFDTDRFKALATLRKALSDIVVYDYFDTTPKSAIRKPMLPTSEKRLLPDGTNLPQILNTIKINHKQSYKKIVEMLSEVNPNFEDFSFNFLGGNIELMLDEKGLNSAVHVSNISDGTLHFLCLLSILFNPERGKFVCIDEPEIGLHPDMISNITNAVKNITETSTITISTHSENLLDYFELDKVRVFEKNDNNATEVYTYQESDFEGWYEKFSVGKMWRQGDIGGNRYGN
jgi:predicted ATPase